MIEDNKDFIFIFILFQGSCYKDLKLGVPIFVPITCQIRVLGLKTASIG